ncbi:MULTISPECIES: GTP cyclohydrolase I FolE [Microbacterium]|uniref:GTP cyclohydrolase I n=1 Tax=Microbacterium TaxID=33882 RepID=UPI0013A5B6C5|nr:GTP cyclohydrolase I FolE [Microbacterium sp. KCTC 39802]
MSRPERAAAAVRELLLALGEDPDRPEFRATPERVAEHFIASFAGQGRSLTAVIGEPIAISDGESGELVALTGIPFRSTCEHHLLPFDGLAHVYYAPQRSIVGFSRIAALVEAASLRPQLQERLGEQIAGAIMSILKPRGVVVRLEARHACVASRAPTAAASRAVTVALRGTMPPAASYAFQP